MTKPRIAILASGSGSTAEAVIRATQGPDSPLVAEVGLVVCNNPEAFVFERVKNLNNEFELQIATALINGKTHPSGAAEPGAQTDAESAAICQLIEEGDFALVALLGYMKKVRGELLDRYGYKGDIKTARMVNTHPGPLPATQGFWGVHAQEEVLRLKLDHSAQTLHYVAAEYDKGPIIAMHEVPVLSDDTPETLFERVQKVEKYNLPIDLNQLLHTHK